MISVFLVLTRSPTLLASQTVASVSTRRSSRSLTRRHILSAYAQILQAPSSSPLNALSSDFHLPHHEVEHNIKQQRQQRVPLSDPTIHIEEVSCFSLIDSYATLGATVHIFHDIYHLHRYSVYPPLSSTWMLDGHFQKPCESRRNLMRKTSATFHTARQCVVAHICDQLRL